MKPEQVTLKKRISTYRDLDVYKMAMDGAMEVFEITKSFPNALPNKLNKLCKLSKPNKLNELCKLCKTQQTVSTMSTQ